MPMLIPSFMYEGIHTLHHSRTRYGTVDDPEYLPLALMKPWTVPLFVLVSPLAPIALAVPLSRVLTPLVAADPAAAPAGWERYSGLVDQPAVPPPPARGRVPPSMGVAGKRRLRSGAIAADRRGVVIGWRPLRALLILARSPRRRWCSTRSARWSRICGRMTASAMTVTAQYPRSGQRPAAGAAARAVGAGRPALSCAAPPAAGPALSLAGRGASPPEDVCRRTRNITPITRAAGASHRLGNLRAVARVAGRARLAAEQRCGLGVPRLDGALFLGPDQHHLADQRGTSTNGPQAARNGG